VRYVYGQPAPGADAAAARQAILAEAATRDLRFLSDQDPPYHPRADRWANGTDPAAELRRMMKVRRAALDRFGEATITRGTPLALMEEALVPVFLHHRYQIDAAASALGGQYYVYAMRGDGETPRRPVPAAEQRAALEALMATLKTSELVVPKRVLDAIPPRPPGFDLHRELFPRFTGLPFDPTTPGLTAADLTLTRVLDPERAARLIAQVAYDPTLPSFEEIVDRTIAAVVDETPADAYAAAIHRAVERALVDRLITLAASAPMPAVRAVAASRLQALSMRLMTTPTTGANAAHVMLLAGDIARFMARPYVDVKPAPAPAAPPGAPIGARDAAFLSPDDDWCGPAARPRPFFPPLVVDR